MPSLKLEELRVYQLSESLADAIWEVVVSWERFPRDTVGKQIVRAADSIGANIAEGFGRGSFADNKRFVRIARGSLYEVRHFLRRSDRRKFLTREQKRLIQPVLRELAPTLNAYLKSIGKSETEGDQGPGTKDK